MSARRPTRKKPTRAQLKLQRASLKDLRRLSPKENVEAGHSPKARNYVLASKKRVTKATLTISARAYETKRAKEIFGLTPKEATEARKLGAERGGIDYLTTEQRERVEKAGITREIKRAVREIEKLHAAGERIPVNGDTKRHGRSFALTADSARQYEDVLRRKAAGETIPDGEWQAAMDIAKRVDPKGQILLRRGSPGAFGFRLPPGFERAA